MAFQDETFDSGFMMHVGMNIDDKARLFSEIYRVLRPGASFGVYDVMQDRDGELTYPVPWATEESTSNLSTPGQYRDALTNAGFDVLTENNRCDFALEFFRQVRARAEGNGGSSPLGLHTLMQESTAVKIENMIDNIAESYIAPVEIIATKIS